MDDWMSEDNYNHPVVREYSKYLLRTCLRLFKTKLIKTEACNVYFSTKFL